MGAFVNFVNKNRSKGLTYPAQSGIIKRQKNEPNSKKIGKRQSTSCRHPRVAQENHIGEKGSIFTVFLRKTKNNKDKRFRIKVVKMKFIFYGHVLAQQKTE